MHTSHFKKRQRILAAAGLLACGAVGSNAFASSWQPYPATMSNHFVNPRPAAMGEAFTAVVDDQNALYYNPAGLARLGPWGIDYLDILTPMIGVTNFDAAAYSTISKNQDLQFSMITKDKATYDKFRGVLRDLKGEPYYARVGLNPFFIMKNFGLGVYFNTELSLSLHEGNTLARLETIVDGDIRAGYAHNFMGDKLAAGLAVGYRTRGNIDHSLRVDSLNTYTEDKSWYKKVLKTGWTIPVDAGLLFTPIETWSPTFGLAVQNIGDAKFYKMDAFKDFSESKPDPLRQTVNAGFSLTPRFGKKLFVRGDVDFRDMNLPTPASRKFRLGLEGGFERLFTVMAGLADEGISAGFEAKLFILNLRYATYVVERGYAAGQKLERRHLLNVKVLL